MTDQREILRTISWQDFCPWFILARSFSLAISLQLLSLATAGIVTASLGWWLCAKLFFEVGNNAVFGASSSTGIQATAVDLATWPGTKPTQLPPHVPKISKHGIDAASIVTGSPVFGVWQRMNLPFQSLFTDASSELRPFGYFACGGLWTLFTWSFFGAAISRSAALQLTVDERPSLFQVIRYAGRKILSYTGAPVLPLLFVAAISIALLLTVGLLAKWDWSLWLAGILWGPGLLASFIMAVVLLGLYVGWPLMWSAISVEGTDAFDALSRSYSYVFQRPLHYLFYALVATVLGTLGWFLVFHFSESVIRLSIWGTAWSTGSERWIKIEAIFQEAKIDANAFWFGSQIIGLWVTIVRTIAFAFNYSFFWSAFAAIYLLLRRDVDQTEMDEVHLNPQEESYGLPPLITDDVGVPSVAEVESPEPIKASE